MADDEAKLTDIYSFRLPAYTKGMVDSLPPEDRHDLNRRLRIEIAKKLHEIKFDPKLYLGDNNQ